MIFYTNQGDTPIFCTNTDELGFVREGVVGERISKENTSPNIALYLLGGVTRSCSELIS